MDLQDLDNVRSVLETARFDALIHPAAITGLEACEDDPEMAMRVNAEAPALLAELCAKRACPFIFVSTDYVFDGVEAGEKAEEDEARPVNVYGRTKLAGERAVLEAYPRAWVARVSWLFGPERPGFVEMIRDRALAGEALAAIDDKVSCPTFVDDAAVAFDRLLELGGDGGGVVHVCNPGPTTWHAYAEEVVRHLSLIPKPPVARQRLADMKMFRAVRPTHTAMAVDRLQRLTGHRMRPWQDALAEYLKGLA